MGAPKKIIFAKVLQETSQRRWVLRDAKNSSCARKRKDILGRKGGVRAVGCESKRTKFRYFDEAGM